MQRITGDDHTGGRSTDFDGEVPRRVAGRVQGGDAGGAVRVDLMPRRDEAVRRMVKDRKDTVLIDPAAPFGPFTCRRRLPLCLNVFELSGMEQVRGVRKSGLPGAVD